MPNYNQSLRNFHKLNKEFYLRDVCLVAMDLLGKLFVKFENNTILSGMITEVEAYDGKFDLASHSNSGMTKRNKDMFSEGGITYVYLTYGIHHCLNVVTGDKGYGAAVLIRSMEPIDGISIFAKRRFNKKNINEYEFNNLLNGPGKICQAFNLNRNDSGKDLMSKELFICNYKSLDKNHIATSKRIGISKSIDLPWRFYISNSKFLSR